MAELLQGDLNAVGFKTRIKTIDSTTFYDVASKGKHHMFLGDATPLKVSAGVFDTLFFGCDNPLNLRVGGAIRGMIAWRVNCSRPRRLARGMRS